ncbi:putative hydrolase of the HAD superfamily [Vibrio xiamenensis]|uniref:Putative hydrolase of the HAD superfamily n=1 Tax=Vibrio xiamenensis TaxID=861298 RepID=A0A1G8HQN5_9VIBR|nr:HAD family hydrolase [Vibrio xiamenensis]SDI08949.1 putative hydrolase of the HAD superfamily [Vibrio xiamenensis]
MAIKAVYFDLDNTLVDRTASIERFATMLIKKYGSRLYKHSPESISSIIKVVDNGGYLATDSKYAKISEAVGCELSNQLDWKLRVSAKELIDFWKVVFPQSAVEMVGAKNLLRSLYNQGYFLGVISNGAHASRIQTLMATSFYSLISQVVSSGSFGKKKPNPEIFVDTMASQRFCAHECMYVGDHPINDAIGSLNSGMRPVLLKGYHPSENLPDSIFQIESLSEVESLVISP